MCGGADFGGGATGRGVAILALRDLMPAKGICGGRAAGVLDGDSGGLVGFAGSRGRVAEECISLNIAPGVGVLEWIDLCRCLEGGLARAGGGGRRPNAPGQAQASCSETTQQVQIGANDLPNSWCLPSRASGVAISMLQEKITTEAIGLPAA